MIALQWQDKVLSLLDQSKYPQEESWITCSTVEETVAARTTMEIVEIMAAGAASAYLSALKSPRAVLTASNRSRKTPVREVIRK